MSVNLPVVLFFARGYQAQFFPLLTSTRYRALFVTMTRAERLAVERRGGTVVGSFEEEFRGIRPLDVPQGYLLTSFMSDRFLGHLGYEGRREVLGKELAFWQRLLDQHAPAAVINELVAIEISEVLLIECRRRGIRYLAGMNCLVDNYFYWLPDPLSLSGRHLPVPLPGEAAQRSARQYMLEVAARDYKPFYVQNLSGRRALTPLLVGVAKWALWKIRRLSARLGGAFRYEIYDGEYAKRIVAYFKGLVVRYDRLEDLPAGSEVIFFPLHQEPEATLNYMSEFYANQVATIENLLKCLAANQVLVVKEHPVDKGSLLLQKFLQLRRRCTGLYFLPAEVHAREVLRFSSRVVTLTSTVGWEAAVMGQKVYVLGQIFYDCLPGVSAIRDFAQLKRELRAPLPAAVLTGNVAERFVAAMVEQSFPGNPFPHERLYSADNLRLVVDAIEKSVANG